jgi:hypothetical protein
MARKANKAPVRRKAVAKAVKRKAAKAKAAKRAPARKKAARKAESTLEKIENAMMAGVAEFDELALDMGLLGAAGPAPKKKRKKTRR